MPPWSTCLPTYTIRNDEKSLYLRKSRIELTSRIYSAALRRFPGSFINSGAHIWDFSKYPVCALYFSNSKGRFPYSKNKRCFPADAGHTEVSSIVRDLIPVESAIHDFVPIFVDFLDRTLTSVPCSLPKDEWRLSTPIVATNFLGSRRPLDAKLPQEPRSSATIIDLKKFRNRESREPKREHAHGFSYKKMAKSTIVCSKYAKKRLTINREPPDKKGAWEARQIWMIMARLKTNRSQLAGNAARARR